MTQDAGSDRRSTVSGVDANSTTLPPIALPPRLHELPLRSRHHPRRLAPAISPLYLVTSLVPRPRRPSASPFRHDSPIPTTTRPYLRPPSLIVTTGTRSPKSTSPVPAIALPSPLLIASHHNLNPTDIRLHRYGTLSLPPTAATISHRYRLPACPAHHLAYLADMPRSPPPPTHLASRLRGKQGGRAGEAGDGSGG